MIQYFTYPHFQGLIVPVPLVPDPRLTAVEDHTFRQVSRFYSSPVSEK